MEERPHEPQSSDLSTRMGRPRRLREPRADGSRPQPRGPTGLGFGIRTTSLAIPGQPLVGSTTAEVGLLAVRSDRQFFRVFDPKVIARLAESGSFSGDGDVHHRRLHADGILSRLRRGQLHEGESPTASVLKERDDTHLCYKTNAVAGAASLAATKLSQARRSQTTGALVRARAAGVEKAGGERQLSIEASCTRRKKQPSYGKAHSANHRHSMNAPFAAKTPREAARLDRASSSRRRRPGNRRGPKGKPPGRRPSII